MKAKTKDQLRLELAATNSALNVIKGKSVNFLVAFTRAAQEILAQYPEHYEIVAEFVAVFFAHLEVVKALDFIKPKLLDDELIEETCIRMGFDEVTSTVIKQHLKLYLEISQMLKDGKSREEIQDFIRENRKGGNK